jgi:uncharacterized protein (TIGR03435 family)
VQAGFAFMPLEALVAGAYGVSRQQVSGAAAISIQPFNIAARAARGLTRDQVRLMLQVLLAERWV